MSNESQQSNSESETPQPETPPTEATSNTEVSEEVKERASSIKIGSQRTSDDPTSEKKVTAKPAGLVEAPTEITAKQKEREQAKPADVKVDLPNLREGMSEALEAEIDAALGGQSIDSLIDQTGMAPPREILPRRTKVHCKILRINDDDIFVDLGGNQEGIVSARQFGEKIPAPGESIELVVQKYDENENMYHLNKPGGKVEAADWSEIEVGNIVEARVTGQNTGGLECLVGKIRGFIPMSQIDIHRVENLAPFINQKLDCKITEAKPKKKNLVLSRRAVLQEKLEGEKEQRFKELAAGATMEGVVRNVLDFGAFVDLGGIDGMIPVAEMSWARVKHPKDIVSEGQQVKVKILKIHPNSKKITLSLRDLIANPWDQAAEKYHNNDTVKGKVAQIKDFGAFIELEPGIQGLVHISELAHKRVMRVTDMLKEGQEVEAKINEIDLEKKRISLSMKALQEPPKKEKKPEEEIPETEPYVSKRTEPLKGGLNSGGGGESIGLNW